MPESAASGLDALASMRNRRKHRNVPPPKRPALAPQAPAGGPEGSPEASSAGEAEIVAVAAPEPVSEPVSEPEPLPTAWSTPPADRSAGSEPEPSRPRPAKASAPKRPSPRARERVATPERRIAWTPGAKGVRLALTAYVAGLRKLEERAEEVREAAERVAADDLALIIQKVAEDSGGDPDELRKVVSSRRR